MTNKKTTKRALLMSLMAMLLCVTMLVGTTFAWFTDSASSANNVIKSGNLDMKLSYKPYGAENTEWTEIGGAPIFDPNALYEPGYTEAIWLKVENIGSLAFKYSVTLDVLSEVEGVNKAGGKFKLSDYLVLSSTASTNYAEFENFFKTSESLASSALSEKPLKGSVVLGKNYVVYPGEDSALFILVVLQMPTTVGNEANHNGTDIPSIKFGINAVATQVPYESDSFGNQYDKDADDIMRVTTIEQFKAALKNGGKVVLEDDIVITDTLNITADTKIDLNGNALTVSRLEARSGADVTISGGNLIHGESNYPAVSVVDGGKLTLDTVTVISENYCNIMTSGNREAAEFVGIQVFGGTCVLNNCDIEVKIEDKRYANSAVGVGIHGGSLTMNGGSIIVSSVGSTNANYDSQVAIFAGSNTDKTVTLNNVTVEAKDFLCASKGNVTVNTTAAEGTWDSKCTATGGTYTINYNYAG